MAPDITKTVKRFLISRQGLQKVLVNTLWLFADRSLYLVLSLIVGALVARYLGPDLWGELNFAASYVALFTAIAALGLDEIVVRALVRQDATTEEILGTTFAFRFAAALLALALTVVTIFQVSQDSLTRVIVLITAGGLLIQPFNSIELWFQARVESKYVVWVKNASLILINALKILFIIGRLSVVAFAWAALLWQVMTAVGLLYVFSKHGPQMHKWRPKAALGFRLLRDSWPMIIAGVATAVYLKIDQVMLGSLIDSEAVGIYGAAVRLSEMWYFIPSAIAFSLFPAIVRSREQKSPEVYQQRVQAFFDLTALICLGIEVGLFIFADPIVRLLFGPDYLSSIPILRVHVWSVIFGALGTARNRVLLAENRTGFVMVATILGALTNVLLNLWLLPTYAGLGAAWATVLSYATSFYLTSLLQRSLWPTFLQQSRALLLPVRLVPVFRSIREVVLASAKS